MPDPAAGVCAAAPPPFSREMAREPDGRSPRKCVQPSGKLRGFSKVAEPCCAEHPRPQPRGRTWGPASSRAPASRFSVFRSLSLSCREGVRWAPSWLALPLPGGRRPGAPLLCPSQPWSLPSCQPTCFLPVECGEVSKYLLPVGPSSRHVICGWSLPLWAFARPRGPLILAECSPSDRGADAAFRAVSRESWGPSSCLLPPPLRAHVSHLGL